MPNTEQENVVAHFWNVYQGEVWLAEVSADSPAQAIQDICLKQGLESVQGMRAVEFDPDVNDPNVRWIPYGHDLDEPFADEEAIDEGARQDVSASMAKEASVEFLIITQGGAECSFWVKQEGSRRTEIHGSWFPRECESPTAYVYVMTKAEGKQLHSQILTGEDWELLEYSGLRQPFFDMILAGAEPHVALQQVCGGASTAVTRKEVKSDTYVRAIIRFVESVETSDDSQQFHSGPDYDVYEIIVETGPARAFLTWFEHENEYDLCRVGDTSQFLDMGGAKTPVDGERIDFTFEEFFPRWLDSSVRVALAETNRRSRDAIARIGQA